MNPAVYWERQSIRWRCNYIASIWDDRLRAVLRRGLTAHEVAKKFGLEIETVLDLQESMWSKDEKGRKAP